MRRFLSVSAGVLILTAITLPVESHAQIRLHLPGIGNPVAGAIQGVGRILGLRARHHIRRPANRAARPTPRAARQIEKAPAATGAATAQAAAAAAAGAETGALFWPDAYGDLLRYVFLAGDAPQAFWSRGYGEIMQATFSGAQAPSSSQDNPHVAAANETTGAAPSADTGCAAEAPQAARQVFDLVAEKLAPANRQDQTWRDLQQALLAGSENISPVCAASAPALPPQRMQVMKERLWALHVAGYNLRAHLARFYDALSPAEKKQLEEAQAKDAPDADPRLCAGLVMRESGWPDQALAQKVNGTPEQRGALKAIGDLSDQMQKSIAASCPQQRPTTPLARLDAALDRIDGLFYASNIMQPAFAGFYGSLTDDQKTRLQTIEVKSRT